MGVSQRHQRWWAGGSNVHELTGWESLIGPTDLSQNTRQGDEDEMQGERRPTRRLA